MFQGFPGGLDGKDSARNAGDPGSIPGWCQEQRTRLPMQETQESWVQFLGWEDPLEEGTAAHPSTLEGCSPQGRKELGTTEMTQNTAHMFHMQWGNKM